MCFQRRDMTSDFFGPRHTWCECCPVMWPRPRLCAKNRYSGHKDTCPEKNHQKIWKNPRGDLYPKGNPMENKEKVKKMEDDQFGVEKIGKPTEKLGKPLATHGEQAKPMGQQGKPGENQEMQRNQWKNKEMQGKPPNQETNCLNKSRSAWRALTNKIQALLSLVALVACLGFCVLRGAACLCGLLSTLCAAMLCLPLWLA